MQIYWYQEYGRDKISKCPISISCSTIHKQNKIRWQNRLEFDNQYSLFHQIPVIIIINRVVPLKPIKEDARTQELKDQFMSGLSDPKTKELMMKRLTLKINDVNRDAKAQEDYDMVGSEILPPPATKIILMPKPNIIFVNPQDNGILRPWISYGFLETRICGHFEQRIGIF